MEKSIKAVIGHLKGETKTTTQSIIFEPKASWTITKAENWIKKHGYKDIGLDETESSYRFRQRDPGEFVEGSFRTITLKHRRTI